MSYTGQVWVITGGSSGIGKAMAMAALAKGANVAVCGRSMEKLRDAFPTISNENILLHAADVGREADSEAFINAVIAKWGRVDVLVNNAGISMRALFKDVDLQVIKDLMNINFWGTVYCTKFALPSLMANKGVVVGISSIAGYRGLPARTGYSASKFAVQGFLEALRTELLHSGTHVMWVSPGFTSSNIRNVALDAGGGRQGETPLDEGRLMSAEQCADIILTAVAKRKRTVVMTMQGKLTVLLNKWLPALADRLVFNHFAKESDSPVRKS